MVIVCSVRNVWSETGVEVDGGVDAEIGVGGASVSADCSPDGDSAMDGCWPTVIAVPQFGQNFEFVFKAFPQLGHNV